MDPLGNRLDRFEEIVTAPLPWDLAEGVVARALYGVCAMRSGSSVLRCVGGLIPGALECKLGPHDLQSQAISRLSFPPGHSIRNGVRNLLRAAVERDAAAMIAAIDELGIGDLWRDPQSVLTRLNSIVARVEGRRRLIPFVELAILAAELQCYQDAKAYLAESRAFAPGPSEWHDLHTVAGIIALSEGDLNDAKDYLQLSISACTQTELGRIACSMHAPNLLLAERLLTRGETGLVLDFLLGCSTVWARQAVRIASWSALVHAGRIPDFETQDERPLHRMRRLVLSSLGLTTESGPGSEPLGTFDLEDFDNAVSEIRDEIRAALRGKLKPGTN